MKFLFSGLLVLSLFMVSLSAPQKEEEEPAEPYEYKYEVNDPDSKNFYGHEEAADGKGKTMGKYMVWLADGRLMTVEYEVDGDSGFKPKITFSDANFTPDDAKKS